MQLKQLQYFIVSVDMGSLSRAAEALYTTQPHVSKTIKLLEDELGLTLLERLPTGVAVTEQGKKVYEYARRVLSGAQKIADVKYETEHHKLQLTSMPSAELAHIFAGFFGQENELSTRFLEGPLEQVLHHVSHHHADIGFLFVSEYQSQALKNMLRHNRLVFYPLRDTELVLYVGPQNPYYRRESVNWADLRKIRYVQNSEEDISLIQHIGHTKDTLRDRQQIQIAASVSNDHVMLQLLRETELANIGCCLCGRCVDPALSIIPIEGQKSRVQFGYVMRMQYVVNEYEQRFLEYVIQQLQ